MLVLVVGTLPEAVSAKSESLQEASLLVRSLSGVPGILLISGASLSDALLRQPSLAADVMNYKFGSLLATISLLSRVMNRVHTSIQSFL